MMATNLFAALAGAFIATAGFTPLFIKNMSRLQYGQQIREDGPAGHSVKAGTPTMGGLVFIPAAIVAAILLAGLSPALYAVLLVTIGCALIGFLDDYGKIAHGRSLGLKARSKLGAEVVLTGLLVLALYRFGLYSTAILVPFVNMEIDLGLFHPLFIFLVISGTSNSVNLTDGLDGLAAGTSVIGFSAFAAIAWQAGLPEVAVFCAALAGGCLGFLVYNRYPARLFMGDVGSLALGGAFAAIAVVTGTELFLILVGGVFVIEALSVIIQVASFRLTGRRVLLMSPLHHHFEMKGWPERKVVALFWAAAIGFALLGILAYGR